MTNKEAIMHIKELRPKKCKMVGGRLQGGFPDHDSDMGKALDMAIEALEKQEKMWIPVSERLPEKEESVIVTVKDDSADSPIYYTSMGWYCNGIWIVENTVCYQVTAWMPLPEPHKGES